MTKPTLTTLAIGLLVLANGSGLIISMVNFTLSR